MKHWVIVVSKDHIARGIAGGFIQANHDRQDPLKRMAAGDWIIIYSPKQSIDGMMHLQAFTAIGQISGDDIYQHTMNAGFTPYRRNVSYYACAEVPITPLIAQLDFITNKKAWGSRFRFGFFEIAGLDFERIKTNANGTTNIVNKSN